jgi:hypothetical protein
MALPRRSRIATGVGLYSPNVVEGKFDELRQEVSKLVHLSDTPTPIENYHAALT